MAESRIAAVVLAAGQSMRMGADNKLLADINGQPMVRVVTESVLASRAHPVVVVTGHDGPAVRAALAGLDVDLVDNPGSRAGLSTSLRAGLNVLRSVDGVVVVLGDMPWVTAADIDCVLDAFAPDLGREIIVPIHEGKRGNPVLWAARFLPELARVTGDRGGRTLLEEHGDVVHHVTIGRGTLLDVDRPSDLAAGGVETRD